jgi:hypothetical protein
MILLLNEATINSKTWYYTIVRPRKCKRSEYIQKGEKKRARDFLVTHIQIVALVLTGSPVSADPFEVLYRAGINLLTSISFGLSFLPT